MNQITGKSGKTGKITPGKWKGILALLSLVVYPATFFLLVLGSLMYISDQDTFHMYRSTVFHERDISSGDNLCNMQGCDQPAVKRYTLTLHSAAPESPNYELEVNEYSGTKTKTVADREKNTYLVPEDGKLKVETETHWVEREVADGSYHLTTSDIAGYYCEAHSQKGQSIFIKLLKNDIAGGHGWMLPAAGVGVVLCALLTIYWRSNKKRNKPRA